MSAFHQPRRTVLAIFATLAFSAHAQQTYSPAQFTNLHYREVGPYRGGRVTTVTGVPSQPLTFYMGTVGGGVWKSTDAGHSWNNLTDGQFSVGSMGAVEVSQSDPNVIYAGTGSSKIRSNVSIGRGIYKSSDAGKTWQFLGLRDVGQIATIRVNPTDANDVFVAAQGNPFIANKERGVWRSQDGGKTWKQVLSLSPDLGAADLELQPGHPNVVFACMWHGLRHPWTIISGSPASDTPSAGIYKSTDSGAHWTKLANGLPTGEFGRANVALSNAAPDRLYALIEAKPGAGLYRSDDAGSSWTLVNGEGKLTTRPFYYDTLGVDPNHPDTVFVGDENWMKSTDAGQTFRNQRTPHGDNHDVWINPKNSQFMIQANDGGANVSLDGGVTWSTQANQPTAEIYQVAADDQFPYRLYGAQQDNTTVIVPSLPLGNGQEFREGPGCETGPIIPKLNDPTVVWGGCKGQFTRLNLTTNNNEQRFWVGSESLYGNEPPALEYRFQRVSPMEISPFEPNTVYYGSQFLSRSKDGGLHWEKLSPDLTAKPARTQYGSGEPITRDATGEEMYSTLYAIRESPLKQGVIWTGSNDGLVYVTQDNGQHWSNVTPPGLKPGGRIQNIEPGHFQPGTAYLAIYRYLLGDFAPYLYRTDDFGHSWTCLTDGHNGIAPDEPTRVLREDPARPGLLYAGTEFGMYVSFNRGEQWQKFQLNLPAVPVTDMKVAAHSGQTDLVLSTQGRGFWILDDLSALEQLPPAAEADSTRLYKPSPAIRIPANGDHGSGNEGPQYPLAGANIHYFLAANQAGPVTLNILDSSGKVVRSLSSVALPGRARTTEEGGGGDEEGRFRPQYPATLDATPGMHRFTWDLRYTGGWMSDARPNGVGGPMAAPGSYTVQLTAGAFTSTQPLEIIEDSRVTADGVTTADLQAQLAHNLRVFQLVTDVNHAIARIQAAQTKRKQDGTADSTQSKELAALADKLITSKIRYSQPKLQTHVLYLYTENTATDQQVGQDALDRYQQLRKQFNALQADLNRILGPA